MTSPVLIHLATVDSTQAFLKRHPELGFCAVLADHQTAGVGRQGHRWESAAGAGLWLSVALPPPALSPGLVMQRAMGAAAQVLDPSHRVLGLKWPNDLVAWTGGRLHKVGGILGEQTGGRLILGLGVNLKEAPHLPSRAIPAASLTDLGLDVLPGPKLAIHIARSFMNLDQHPQPAFLWPEPGAPIRWEAGQGTCLGWEPDGRLKVATASGIQRISAGEVVGLASVNGP
ncbi:MAG: hypothetical protein KGI56_07910 [Acidobacteriota bacterium]|nr:hypothetical protein [Acidobacteriota bacterium]